MWCWRCILRIPWTMRRTNASILEEIGVSKQILHTSNIQMLSYFGHIARRKGNNLEKVIMQGMIEKKRRKRWPRSWWIDQIRSAIGLPLHDCYALAEDRHLWRCIYEVTSCQPWQERINQPLGYIWVGGYFGTTKILWNTDFEFLPHGQGWQFVCYKSICLTLFPPFQPHAGAYPGGRTPGGPSESLILAPSELKKCCPHPPPVEYDALWNTSL